MSTNLNHPVGRALTSDWFASSFLMVVCENFEKKLSKEQLKSFLIDNHHKTIYDQSEVSVLSASMSNGVMFFLTFGTYHNPLE